MNCHDFARRWNESYPPRFRITPEAAWNQGYRSDSFRPDWSGWVTGQRGAAAVLVAKDGPTEGLAHVSALAGEPLAARQLLRDTVAKMKADGVTAVRFGADLDHFWPGAPTTVGWLDRLLDQSGFVFGAELYDMGRDLAGYTPVARAKPLGARVARCDPRDLGRLDAFLAEEFPGRWRGDTARKATEEPEDVFILLVEGKVRGFAVTQTPGCKRPHAGAVFRSGLGDRWCTLGPIGVGKAVRGRGLGDALLSEALVALQEGGGRGCTIDWTVLTEFYGRHGFLPTATYRTAELSLAPVS